MTLLMGKKVFYRLTSPKRLLSFSMGHDTKNSADNQIQLWAPSLGEMVRFSLEKTTSYVSNIYASSSHMEEVHKQLNDELECLNTLKSDCDGQVLAAWNKRTTNEYNLWTKKVEELNDQVADLNK
ncbi:uncharacterized protein LOC129295042 [Prosopis cineraria]|uniref:uncharacterized protein LOC129295042 n=1 Tax=Prosopis cineraria TaxID=364024 RepID=UPI00240FC388|nr:uncharacterized protein LOC129295042 [Prosopis cineraria]